MGKEPKLRDPAKKEQIIKAAADNKPLPAKSLPTDLLDKVTGGDTLTVFDPCPRCGELLLLDNYPGGWEIYCPVCNLCYDSSSDLDW